LVDHGFRLPSALDNRPLKFEEFEEKTNQNVYVSATPGPFEREHTKEMVEQIIRPTGLLDPKIDVRPVEGQIDDLIGKINQRTEIKTLERIEIIRDLRVRKYDVLVGINLLREGLDIPEVSLVTILDADKEGFLRSERSLIQTMGRAARNENGQVIMYADKITD